MRRCLVLFAGAVALQLAAPLQARADATDTLVGMIGIADWRAAWPTTGSGNGNGNGNVGSFNGNFNLGNGNGNFNTGSFEGNGSLEDCRGNGGRDVGGFIEVGPPHGKVRCQCFMSNSTQAHACHGGGSSARIRP